MSMRLKEIPANLTYQVLSMSVTAEMRKQWNIGEQNEEWCFLCEVVSIGNNPVHRRAIACFGSNHDAQLFSLRTSESGEA